MSLLCSVITSASLTRWMFARTSSSLVYCSPFLAHEEGSLETRFVAQGALGPRTGLGSHLSPAGSLGPLSLGGVCVCRAPSRATRSLRAGVLTSRARVTAGPPRDVRRVRAWSERAPRRRARDGDWRRRSPAVAAQGLGRARSLALGDGREGRGGGRGPLPEAVTPRRPLSKKEVGPEAPAPVLRRDHLESTANDPL